MRDPPMLDALADVLAQVVSRHGSVRDDAGCWIGSAQDVLGEPFEVAAALHPGDARDAGRDLLDGLAARGLAIHRQPSTVGNGLGARLARLAGELAAAASDPVRFGSVSNALLVFAAEADQRDAAVIPAHLRQARSGLPDSIVRLCDRRRRA